ncbi:MAG TPA: hypothetical protein VI504_10820 [Candidatus Eisenbacteria bacterium]|jgi:hypothetical protein
MPLDADRSGDHGRFAFGLTTAEVARFRDIIRRECGVELTMEAAWTRAIEVLAFAKVLLNSLPPKGA